MFLIIGKELCRINNLNYRGKMTMKIRFCEQNKGTGKVFKKLKENHPEVNIKRKDCLKKCGPCGKAPMALVDGETVKGDDGEELYGKIVALLKKS